jgi:hypothetical protein
MAAPDGVQQQAGGGARVAGVLLDQRARGQDGRLVDLVDRHAVVEVAPRLGQDGLRPHVRAEPRAGRLDQPVQARVVQRHALASIDDVQRRRRDRSGGLALPRALLGTALAVQHVGTSHLVMAAAHEAQLHLILNVLDVEGAAAGA